MVWVAVERPGYFGRHREERRLAFDRLYGKDGWRIVWQLNERQGSIAEASMLYEDAYYEFLCANPLILEGLTQEASEVYDDNVSNVQSGLDYTCQETPRTHVQDIAIRRCLVRMGLRFMGSRLIQIRGEDADAPIHPLSLQLYPGSVPFHRPNWIVQPELAGWWRPQSVEAFYQSNKLLQRKT